LRKNHRKPLALSPRLSQNSQTTRKKAPEPAKDSSPLAAEILRTTPLSTVGQRMPLSPRADWVKIKLKKSLSTLFNFYFILYLLFDIYVLKLLFNFLIKLNNYLI
jgi:hypothetical protein